MRDPRCLIGFHKWVGTRRRRDQQAASLWDEADDGGYVVWCRRCGKDRREGLAWMAGGGGGIGQPSARPVEDAKGVWQVKDIRCVVGFHDYVKKQIEDSQDVECRRCGKDKPAHVHPPGGGFGGG